MSIINDAIDILYEERAKAVAACKAALEVIGDGFVNRSSEVEFGGKRIVCDQCRRHRIEGHAENCKIFRAINLLREAVKDV